MLYPTTIIGQPTPNNIYSIDPGCLSCFPLTLAAGQATRITCIHLGLVQDHSIRVWISQQPGEESVASGEYRSWHPNRTPHETVVVYDPANAAPNEIAIAAVPGNYYVNVLNLINSRNTFSFVLTDLV